MKKFLLLALTAAMLNNPAVCMDFEKIKDDMQLVDELPDGCGTRKDGTVIVPDGMRVVHKRFDCCAGLGAVTAAGLLVHSVCEGDLLLGGATASAFLALAYASVQRQHPRIELYEGHNNFITITRTEDPEGTIDRLKKQIDGWNKLRRENPAAAQKEKDRIRQYFQQHREKNAKKAAPSEDASEQSE